ncbi:MAG: hypothetical protein HC860_25095 [Alkalinema sp. RU_4_3]|nr:hypothetical protein [Alkalinema sp. RU_4_3]
MKWQADEVWMHNQAIAVAQGEEPFPMLGMRNGVGIYNPGLSVWAFVGLAKFQIDPVVMVQWVQWSNVAAIALFTGFVLRCVPWVEQSIWLWGLAIASVNPLAIIFSRALWAQDLLPLFCTVAVMGHWGAAEVLGGVLSGDGLGGAAGPDPYEWVFLAGGPGGDDAVAWNETQDPLAGVCDRQFPRLPDANSLAPAGGGPKPVGQAAPLGRTVDAEFPSPLADWQLGTEYGVRTL